MTSITHASAESVDARGRVKTLTTMGVFAAMFALGLGFSLRLLNPWDESWFVQVVLLAFGVYTAYRSGDAEAAGKVVAIFLLAPQLMGPIQALSVYLIMAGSAATTLPRLLRNAELRREARRSRRTRRPCGRHEPTPARTEAAGPTRRGTGCRS